jgi:hydroxyethylthiazole kinase-like uncharacterized protein yjeF
MADLDSWSMQDAVACVSAPTDADDKYRRGVVGLRTGSVAYPGAAVLGVEAAYRTGIGMVRYLGPDRAADLVLQRRPEAVTTDGRVQAWVVGSGTDAATRPEDATAALAAVLAGPVPVVVDAGALTLAVGASAPRIVTPHRREFAVLRDALGLAAPASDADLDTVVASVRETAAALDAVVLLKGSTTVVVDPGGWTTVVRTGTPWLATAGTGDVLAGVIGAVVAAAVARADALGRDGGADALVPDGGLGALAATGAWLHGRAGTLASGGRPGRPITALDVADALPHAVAEVIAG